MNCRFCRLTGVRGGHDPAGKVINTVACKRDRFCLLVVTTVLVALIVGCSSTEQNLALAAGITVAGSYPPSQEIEQVYYLGVIDPQGQLPPNVYRIRVHGQASALSFTRFATGWAPATFVDNLNTNISFDLDPQSPDRGKLKLTNSNDESISLAPGRRMVLFGPEGFIESPKDHRLVIVMGVSPQEFFQAIGDSVKAVTQIEQERNRQATSETLLKAQIMVQDELRRLSAVDAESKRSVAARKGDQP